MGGLPFYVYSLFFCQTLKILRMDRKVHSTSRMAFFCADSPLKDTSLFTRSVLFKKFPFIKPIAHFLRSALFKQIVLSNRLLIFYTLLLSLSPSFSNRLLIFCALHSSNLLIPLNRSPSFHTLCSLQTDCSSDKVQYYAQNKIGHSSRTLVE